MKENLKELKEDVASERKHIEEAVERLIKLQAEWSASAKDDTIEPAMGTYLMNFYNGIEHILKRICRVYYETFPRGANWHKELLDLSYMPPKNKPPIFSKEVVVRLYQYKNFRHRFISGYGFQLRAEKMFELINDVESLWRDVQSEIDRFFRNIEK